MFVAFQNYRDRQRLAAVIADTDRVDPGWRLTEMFGNRPPLSDNENGAKRLLTAFQLRQKEWIPQALETYLNGLGRCEPLLVGRAKELREALAAKESALVEARKMASLPRGRFAIDWTTNPLTARIPIDEVRSVTILLMFDVECRLQDGDMGGALGSCRAAIRGSQYIRDDPCLVSLLVGFGCQAMTLEKIERLLGQAQAGEDALLELQKALEQEERDLVPAFRRALRGERASVDHLLDLFDRDQLPSEMLITIVSRMTTGLSKTGYSGFDDWFEEFLAKQSIKSIPAARAALLEYNGKAIEIAQSPLENVEQRLKGLETTLVNHPALVRVLAPRHSVIAQATCRRIAHCRSAIAAIAVERYRLKYGRWPNSLSDLIPDLMPVPPMDPYRKASLGFAKVTDGVVIYSVGPDGKDDGGDVDGNHPATRGTDIGFRLWDPDKRRQPPPAKAEEKNP
jgi:hypothetical protein